ncbi:MAG: SCO family protein [Candidatus Poribacteria bacterium]|nr:SCO family protein [Candidatus Poribacteria bacterium]
METETPAQNPKPRERLRHGLLWGVLIVVIVGIVGANIWSPHHQDSGDDTEPDLSVHHQVPDFSLIDQRGALVTPSDLRGKIWVVDFIFTRCVAACPLMTDKMKKLQEEFAESGVYFVSVSVDPEYDTPDVLFQYANRFGVDGNTWLFLTGEKENIYHLTQDGFGLAIGQQESEVLHSARFVLVDHRGQIRGYYDSNEDEALQKLRRDIPQLLIES